MYFRMVIPYITGVYGITRKKNDIGMHAISITIILWYY